MMLSQRGALTGSAMRPTASARGAVVVRAAAGVEERLRLHNLSPQVGARRDEMRKGRGYGGHQGGTCGFGTRGQKSRSGPGVRPGFEGGQTPLYRRLPKLRGIAGGMSAGVPKYVVVNLGALEAAFDDGAEVTLEAVKAKGLLRTSGADDALALKVLGEGSLSKKLTVKAAAFSGAASAKLEAAGAAAEVVPGRAKWTRKAHEAHKRALKKQGLDYEVEAKKKRAARAQGRVARAAAAKAARSSASK